VDLAGIRESAMLNYEYLELDCLCLHCLLCFGFGKRSVVDFVLLFRFFI
jgi:hypothetical protein